MQVNIHGHKFLVNSGELKIIPRDDLNPLVIREDLSSLDRELGLLKRLLSNFQGHLVDYGTRFGGYIPLSLQDIAEKITVITEPTNEKKIVDNPERTITTQCHKKMVEGDILRIERGAKLIYLPLFEYPIIIADKPIKSNHHIVLQYFDRIIQIHQSFWKKFESMFNKNIELDNTGYPVRLTYDNLINMLIMVKNAGDGFRKVLEQNLPFIDQFTVLDTGSTDNTLGILEEVMNKANKRGKFYQEPFINFRDSRNRLLDLAGNDCVFNIMLDDTYVLRNNIREFLHFIRGDDTADSYSLFIKEKDMMYGSNRILKSSKNLRYIHTIHEVIQKNFSVQIPQGNAYIEDLTSEYMTKRTQKRKESDLQLLYNELRNNPQESRTYYYIAETYLCMKDWVNAAEWYQKRSLLNNGYKEEQQDSFYKFAVMNHLYLGRDWEMCHQLYLKAHIFDPERCESMFMIGYHYYYDDYQEDICFMYLKRAFEIGPPSNKYGMNLKLDMYYYHLPKMLAPLCYKFREYLLGEACMKRLLTYKKELLYENWYKIFYFINLSIPYKRKEKLKYTEKKLITFLIDGGWDEWYGKTLRDKGLGGSETWVIRTTEEINNNYDEYEAVVFCKCGIKKKYNGVTYFPIADYPRFIATYQIEKNFVNRFPEYLPAAVLNDIPSYLVLHDLIRSDDIITLHSMMKGIICLTDWHKNQVLKIFPQFRDKIKVMSYGIEVGEFAETKKIKNSFIYSSFPNRGLYWLLKLFPKIVEKYPDAHLDIFCDINHKWVRKEVPREMEEIEKMLEEQKNTVTNHGWVNKTKLKREWSNHEYWFYPCNFMETCCLTGYEAAASKTLCITTDLAALKETIGDRGIIIPGTPSDEEWLRKALDVVFGVMSGNVNKEFYLSKNYEWAKSKCYKNVVGEFVKRFIRPN